MAEELQRAFGVNASLIPGRNGIFDVIIDGKLLFSKYKTGRFPRQGEIAGLLKQ